jgi:hypothetical protein
MKPSKVVKAVASRLVICYCIPDNFRAKMDEWTTWVETREKGIEPREWTAFVNSCAEAIAQSEKWDKNTEMGRCWDDL